jgi:hypothetical protein
MESPSLNTFEFEQLNSLQNNIFTPVQSKRKGYNLAQDILYSKDVYKALDTKDEKICLAIQDILKNSDVSYLYYYIFNI